jgi:hypothetical protein
MDTISKKNIQTKTRVLFILISFFALGLSLKLASAWVEPSLTAPDGNLSAPINIGAITQTKTGGLYVNGGTVTPIVFDTDNVGYYSDPNGTSRMNYGLFDSLASNGSVTATSFLYSSDRNLKQDIGPLNNSLTKILQLQGVNFRWKNPNNSQKLNVGLIAQDVENVYPELVTTSKETGLKSVEYGNLVAPLIEAIKDQQSQIEALKKEIEQLKK